MSNKPIGQLEIDWSHPLARGLKAYVLPSSEGFIDVVSNTLLSRPSGLNGNIYEGKETVDFTATNLSYLELNHTDYSDHTLGVIASRRDNIADTKNRTIVSLGKNATGFAPFSALRNNYSRVDFFWRNDDINDQSGYSTNSYFGYNGPLSHLSLACKRNSFAKVYGNGELNHTDSTVNNGTSTYHFLALHGTKRDTESGTDKDYRYHLAYVYDRALSSEEIQSLYADPYQFLKPVKTVQEQVYPALFSVAVGTEDALTATSISSTSEVSTATLEQTHALTATSIESTSTVSSPSVGTDTTDVLTATSIESTSSVSSPTLGVIHNLTSGNVESTTKVSASTVGQTHILTAVSIESSGELSIPTLGQVYSLTATSIESSSSVSSPDLAGLTLESLHLRVLQLEETVSQLSEDIAVKVNKLVELAGLDPDNPHTISSTQRSSTNIDITITDNGNGSVTLQSQ